MPERLTPAERQEIRERAADRLYTAEYENGSRVDGMGNGDFLCWNTRVEAQDELDNDTDDPSVVVCYCRVTSESDIPRLLSDLEAVERERDTALASELEALTHATEAMKVTSGFLDGAAELLGEMRESISAEWVKDMPENGVVHQVAFPDTGALEIQIRRAPDGKKTAQVIQELQAQNAELRERIERAKTSLNAVAMGTSDTEWMTRENWRATHDCAMSGLAALEEIHDTE